MKTAFVTLALLGLFGTCGDPRKQADKSLAKVADAKAEVQEVKEDINTKAKAFVHGTGLALSAETNRTPAIEMATRFNQRASITLGPPDALDAQLVETIVREGLSGVEERAKRSENLLMALTRQVSDLQSLQAKKEEKVEKLEDKRDSKMEGLAEEAAFARKIKRWLWLAGGGLALTFLMPIIAQVVGVVFPAAGPLVGLFSVPFSIFGKILTRAVPTVATQAGLVSKQVLSETESERDKMKETLKDLMQVIQDIKKKEPVTFEAALKPRLLTATDDDTRSVIKELKVNLPPMP